MIIKEIACYEKIKDYSSWTQVTNKVAPVMEIEPHGVHLTHKHKTLIQNELSPDARLRTHEKRTP
jgi:hypothetical protein